MAREFFKDLPNTTTPLTADRLNGLLNGDEALGSIVVDDVSGKNIYDGNFEIGGYSQTTGEKATSSTQYRNVNPIPCKPNTTYTFSINGTKYTSNIRYFFYDANLNYLSSEASGTGNITTPSNCYYVSYHSTGLKTDYPDGLSKAQIEKGSTATEYIEYKQPVKKTSIGVKEDAIFYANDFKCRNMWIPTLSADGSQILQTRCSVTLSGDTYSFVASGTDIFIGNVWTSTGNDYNGTLGTLYKVKPNTSYTLSCSNSAFSKNFITFYGSNKKSLSYQELTSNVATFTTPNNCEYISIRIGNGSATSGTTYTTTIQLEEGNEATSYTPYKNFDNTPIITQLLSDTTLTASTSYALSDAITNYKYIMLVLTSGGSFENANRQYIPVEQIQGFSNLYRCALSVFQSTSVYMFADMYFADATHIYCNTVTRGTTGWAGHLKVYGIK